MERERGSLEVGRTLSIFDLPSRRGVNQKRQVFGEWSVGAVPPVSRFLVTGVNPDGTRSDVDGMFTLLISTRSSDLVVQFLYSRDLLYKERLPVLKRY